VATLAVVVACIVRPGRGVIVSEAARRAKKVILSNSVLTAVVALLLSTGALAGSETLATTQLTSSSYYDGFPLAPKFWGPNGIPSP
jgi:hypothetical protein